MCNFLLSYIVELKLPIRRKKEMIEAIAGLLFALHSGEVSSCTILIEELKRNALFLDCEVQQGVLMLAGTVQFQVEYDTQISGEVDRCADLLLESLGFPLLT